ncbi:uncharacterized protein LOC102810327, partial [Saccoglossus kowalevskii]|uniref:Uncharacterized protein LOC102810327 n=1 Tax=Saccoglossus kowalevskii TaxID=10224 RepID=A0ABM0MQY3_SACKO
MGVSPRIEDLDYWSLEPALQNPRVARSMTHSRYQKISQYFHLADPRHDPCNMPLTYEERFLRVQEKPLYKLGNFYMQFLGNCIKNYNLHRDICVSEDQLYSPNCVVPNRSPCVKPYVLMDVLTDYVQNIDFTAPLKDGDSKVKDVVNSLVRNVAFRGHHLYVNGFYTSVDLATVLLEQKTYLTGVLHPGYKDAPFEIMDVPQNRASHHVRTLKKGQFLARRYRLASISAVTYRDTSLSTMISTCHEPFVHTADSDWLLRYININNSAHLVKIPAPRMVVEYTQTRSHVNKALQSHTQYATFQSRQHNKWWKNLFQFCLNVALSNAYVCYKEQNKVDTARFDFKTFVLRVVDGLLNNLPRVKPDTPTKPSPTVVDVTSSHKLSLHNGRGKPCFQCKADGRTQPSGYARDTRYFCSVCAVHLCKGMCFTKWHNRLSAGDTMTRNLGRRSFKGAGYRKRFGTGKTFGAMRSEVVRRTGATSSTRSDFRGNVAHSKQYSQMTNSIVSNQASVTADQAMSSTSAMKPTSMTRGMRQGLSDYPQVAANFMRSEQIASSLRTQQGRTESHVVNTDIAQSQHAVTTSSSGQFASNSSLLRSGQSEDTASTCNVTDYLQVVTGYVRSDQSVAGMVSHDHSAPAPTSQHGATELLPVSTHSQKPNQATVSSSHKMTPSRRGKPSSSLSRAVVPFSKAAAVPRPEQVAAAMTSQQLATVMRSYQDIATASGHKIQKVHARGKRCVQCWIDGRRQPSGHPRDTRFFCAVCLVHLCRGLCFAKWHASLSVSKDTDGGGEKGPGKKSKDSDGDGMEKGQTRKSTSQ